MSKSKVYAKKGLDFGSFVMFDNPEDCWEYAKERRTKCLNKSKRQRPPKTQTCKNF